MPKKKYKGYLYYFLRIISKVKHFTKGYPYSYFENYIIFFENIPGETLTKFESSFRKNKGGHLLWIYSKFDGDPFFGLTI